MEKVIFFQKSKIENGQGGFFQKSKVQKCIPGGKFKKQKSKMGNCNFQSSKLKKRNSGNFKVQKFKN